MDSNGERILSRTPTFGLIMVATSGSLKSYSWTFFVVYCKRQRCFPLLMVFMTHLWYYCQRDSRYAQAYLRRSAWFRHLAYHLWSCVL